MILLSIPSRIIRLPDRRQSEKCINLSIPSRIILTGQSIQASLLMTIAFNSIKDYLFNGFVKTWHLNIAILFQFHQGLFQSGGILVGGGNSTFNSIKDYLTAVTSYSRPRDYAFQFHQGLSYYATITVSAQSGLTFNSIKDYQKGSDYLRWKLLYLPFNSIKDYQPKRKSPNGWKNI